MKELGQRAYRVARPTKESELVRVAVIVAGAPPAPLERMVREIMTKRAVRPRRKVALPALVDRAPEAGRPSRKKGIAKINRRSPGRADPSPLIPEPPRIKRRTHATHAARPTPEHGWHGASGRRRRDVPPCRGRRPARTDTRAGDKAISGGVVVTVLPRTVSRPRAHTPPAEAPARPSKLAGAAIGRAHVGARARMSRRKPRPCAAARPQATHSAAPRRGRAPAHAPRVLPGQVAPGQARVAGPIHPVGRPGSGARAGLTRPGT